MLYCKFQKKEKKREIKKLRARQLSLVILSKLLRMRYKVRQMTNKLSEVSIINILQPIKITYCLFMDQFQGTL